MSYSTHGKVNLDRKNRKEAEKLEKFIELREKTKTKPLDLEDLIGSPGSDFERQRIKRDLEREIERKRWREQKENEKRERERIGATAWFEQNTEKYKQKAKEEKEVHADSVLHHVALRKEMRDARRIERLEMERRQEEYEKMQKRWRDEDEHRARERALDEKREREVAWNRLEVKKSALSREREEWKKEQNQRDMKREFEKEMREKRQLMENERDHSVAQDLERIQEKKKRDKKRYLMRTQLSPSAGQGSESDFHSLEANSHFRETFRRKGNVEARTRRIKESEAQTEELKRWYKNREFDRFERHHQAMNAIYT